MRHIGERNSHGKLGSLSKDALDVDRAVVLQYDALGNGEAQTGPADFPGSGFVDAIEPLIDLIKGILRDSDTGILDTDIEVIGICIDRHPDFAVVPVILYGVLNEVRNDHDHLDLIDLRIDFSHADHRQLYVSFLRNGP